MSSCLLPNLDLAKLCSCITGSLLVFTALVLSCLPTDLQASGEDQVLRLIGPQDALILAGPDNSLLLHKNANRKLIPASTLKLVSALAVMDILGQDYRFETHLYAGPQNAVTIKGFGDPLLISEIVTDMVAAVRRAARQRDLQIQRLYVDDTYFTKPIIIPGTTPSIQPYDAPVGAFCVNFNTVDYRIVNGSIRSAEPQTPLLPFAEKLIRRNSNRHADRIVLSHDNEAIALYAAHLVAYFLTGGEGLANESLGLRSVNPATDDRLLVYRSPLVLTDLIQKMMAFSNNFIANQLVIAAGAARYGAPGTLEKAARLLSTYGRQTLGLTDFTIVEGSGISRRNRLTARSLLQVLTEFEPYRTLLRRQGAEYFKTGTLSGVSSRVGYLRRPAGGHYRFAIIMNSPAGSAVRVKRALEDYLMENHFP